MLLWNVYNVSGVSVNLHILFDGNFYNWNKWCQKLRILVNSSIEIYILNSAWSMCMCKDPKKFVRYLGHLNRFKNIIVFFFKCFNYFFSLFISMEKKTIYQFSYSRCCSLILYLFTSRNETYVAEKKQEFNLRKLNLYRIDVIYRAENRRNRQHVEWEGAWQRQGDGAEREREKESMIEHTGDGS